MYEVMKMVYWDFWIFPLFCIGMMFFFMLTGKGERHGGCFEMMHSSKEQGLERKIEDLKAEIDRLKKTR